MLSSQDGVRRRDTYLLPNDWYLWELNEIPGVSYEISKVLYYKGFNSVQDIKSASDDELLKIPGIGEKRLSQIKAHLFFAKLILL